MKKLSFQWTLFLTILSLTIVCNFINVQFQHWLDSYDSYAAPTVNARTVPAALNTLTVDLRDFNSLPNDNSAETNTARSTFVQSYNSIASQIVPSTLGRCNLPRSLN